MHLPVLLKDVVEQLAVRPTGQYVDCTLGGGGHAEALLEKLAPGGRLLGLDRDEEAILRCRQRLSRFGEQFVAVHTDFAGLADAAREQGMAEVDGIMADLGMSSFQVDEPLRGFSFQGEGPLDMRMDRTCGETAEDVVNTLGEKDLSELFWRLGEERSARRVARAIVRARETGPVKTTGQLADVVSQAKGGRKGKAHPATQVFMALRMAVNHELESLEEGLEAAINLVKPGGRVAVITFHSVEDRAVKKQFARHEGRWESLQAGGRRWVGEEPAVKRVCRKPIVASDEEVRENPRARSAKLRVVERVGADG